MQCVDIKVSGNKCGKCAEETYVLGWLKKTKRYIVERENGRLPGATRNHSETAVTLFLLHVYNVSSTRVASLLAFRCIINDQLAVGIEETNTSPRVLAVYLILSTPPHMPSDFTLLRVSSFLRLAPLLRPYWSFKKCSFAHGLIMNSRLSGVLSKNPYYQANDLKSDLVCQYNDTKNF